MKLRRAVLLEVAIVSLSSVSLARAESPAALPASVVVSADGPCRGAGVESAIGWRVRRPVRFEPNARSRVEVRFAEGGSLVSADIAFDGTSGHSARRLHGRSCEVLTSAIAIVAATWLEGESLARDTTSAPSPAEPEASPPSRPEAPPAIRTNVEGKTPPRMGGATATEEASVRSAPTDDARWLLGASGVINLGIVSRPAMGAQAGLAHRMGRSFELRLFLRGAIASEPQAQGEPRLTLGTLPLDACARARLGRVVSVAGCARVEPGVLQIERVGTDSAKPWLGIGPGVRLQWAVASTVTLEAEAFLPFQALGYTVRDDRVELAAFRSLTSSFAAGATVPIP